MNKNPIKQFLINPLMIPANIFNIKKEVSPYLNNTIDLLYELFQSIFPYEKHELEITSILASNGIDDNTLEYIYLNDSVKESIKLIHTFRKILINFYIECTSNIEYGSDAYIIYCTNYEKIINFKIDKNVVKSEISELYSLDENYLISITNNFCDFIEIILNSINIDEDLEIKKGDDNMKKSDKEDIEKYLENELMSSVNDFDKSFGLKLKKPKKVVDDSEKFNFELDEYIYYIFNVLGEINNIASKKLKKQYLKNNFIKYIIKNSKWWNEKYLDNDLAFRCRFMTFYLISFIENIDIIINKMYISSTNKKNMFSEYSCKLNYLNKIRDASSKFISEYIKTGNSSYFMYFVKLQTLSKYESENSKYGKISDQSFLLIKNLKPIVIKNQKILFDTILKLSYMIATNDKKSVKNKFSINSDYRFSDIKITKKHIEKLGKEISKNKYGMSPLFKCYMKTKGVIWTKWDNPSKNLKIGIMAIQLYALCINNKNACNKICSIVSN